MQLYAQLSDQFNNSISSANYPGNFAVVNVFGSTGTVQHFNGRPTRRSHRFVTDANGQIGADGTYAYFVSTKSVDSAGEASPNAASPEPRCR